MYFKPDYLEWERAYVVRMSDEVYRHFSYCESSFNVLYCRLLGVSYADGWRYIRDNYNGKIHGREGRFCYVTFYNERDCRDFCNLLNERWKALIR